MQPRKLVSFWNGKVTWLERLCVHPMLGTGHDVEVFTSEPVKLKLELDCKIRDVQEVMQENTLGELYKKRGWFAFYADMVRLELLRRNLGTWSDLDCLFLRPLDLDEEYVFGLCDEKRVNNAILHLPFDCEMLNDYHAAVNTMPLRAPWATNHIKIRRNIEIFFGQQIPTNPTKMAIGPRALSWFLKKHALLHHAKELPVFLSLIHI